MYGPNSWRLASLVTPAPARRRYRSLPAVTAIFNIGRTGSSSTVHATRGSQFGSASSRLRRRPEAPGKRAGCPAPDRRGDADVCSCSCLFRVFRCPVVGQAQYPLQPRQAPYAIVAPELVKQRCPIATLKGVAQRLRSPVVQRIDEAEKRATVPVMRADQPQHQVRIVRRRQPRIGRGSRTDRASCRHPFGNPTRSQASRGEGRPLLARSAPSGRFHQSPASKSWNRSSALRCHAGQRRGAGRPPGQ